MRKNRRVSLFAFILFVFFDFYSFGAGVIESLVNYPSWKYYHTVAGWIEMRQMLTQRILPLLALPALFLQTISLIVLIIYRPVQIPRWAPFAALGFLLISVISSFTIQIPIQLELDKAYDILKIERLIETDFWLRVLPESLCAFTTFYMLYCVSKQVLLKDTTAARLDLSNRSVSAERQVKFQ